MKVPVPGANNSAPGMYTGSLGPMPKPPPTCNTSTFFVDSIPWAQQKPAYPFEKPNRAGGPSHCCQHCSESFADPIAPGLGCKYWSFNAGFFCKYRHVDEY